jgi:radical SAM superfamily enzyme YgiQ (UPF0313 family)
VFRSRLPDLDLEIPYSAYANSVLDGAPDRVLLVNPPAVDVRLPWSQWIQPTALLRAGSFLKARGADVRYVDCLAPTNGKRLSKSLHDRVVIDGVTVNRWHYGTSARELVRGLEELKASGWSPDLVLVEGLAAHWWPGVAEVSRIVQRQFSSVPLVLLGAYPFLVRKHAERHVEATHFLDTIPLCIQSIRVDPAFSTGSEGSHYLWIGEPFGSVDTAIDEIHEITARRKRTLFAVADLEIAEDGYASDQFEYFLDRLIAIGFRSRFVALGNITLAAFVRRPELAARMKAAGCKQLFFADDRNLPDDPRFTEPLIQEYAAAAEVLHKAGFHPRYDELTGTISIGRLGEDIAERAELATRVASTIGSVVLWPYQPTPSECPAVSLEDTNGRMLPLRQSGSYRDYLELYGLAAILNAKYRQRTFDFLGDGLVPRLFRQSMESRAWEPPDEVKGSLRVMRAEGDTAVPGKPVPDFSHIVSLKTNHMTELVTEHTFDVPNGPQGFRRTLLLNPPVYDAQYWARWSQPAGLLRLGTYLKQCGHAVDLIDCMETDERGFVPKSRRFFDGRPHSVQRDDVTKPIYHFGLRWPEVERRLLQVPEPDEVWITSIMTYWWESTRDAVSLVRQVFPRARVIVGGIYPTLAPDHAAERLRADAVFVGELSAASELPADLSLYEKPPSYSIITTSRGCPWECHYCSARALNGGSNKMRARDPEDVLAEIEFKHREFGIRRFGFYEDNALALRGHLQQILELIIERGLKLELYAPEGFETRLLTVDLLRTMRQAGFEKVHLPFEALRWETNLGWNRRHASTASFERALSAAIEAGFKPRTEEINAFVLFGLPDDNLEQIMDSVTYVHHTVGSIIPMLFTPVPGTQIFREHEQALISKGPHQRDLQDLNGKFLPFLEHNRRRYPALRASDYFELEGLMSILNRGKVLSHCVDLCTENAVTGAFRTATTNLRYRLERV